jgi:serralysin
MGNRHLRFLSSALVLCALMAARAEAYVNSDRWVVTATNPSAGAMGTPITVTWSFAPDGTAIPGANSSLISWLDANFRGASPGTSTWSPTTGYSQEPWFQIFDTAFTRLSALSGLSYVYEPHDDGAMFSSGALGSLGVRGDMRLSAKAYAPLSGGGTDPTLASNFFPDYAEMMINTNQLGYLGINSNNYRRFRNVLMHEAMHGLGVNHVFTSSPTVLLMAPALSSTIDGPQLDDVLALHRLYGDVLEKSGGNDAAASATSLGSLAASQTLTRGTLGNAVAVAGSAVDFVSIDGSSDVDFFSFTLNTPLNVTLSLAPKGTTYQMGSVEGGQAPYNTQALSDLSLALFDSTGFNQIGSTANSQGAGFGESLVRELNAGTYYARITGVQDDVQLYQISVAGAAISAEQLTWTGSSGNAWNVASTANFHNGSTADVFRNGDSVTFTDSVATHLVSVDEAVAPAAMTVNTAAIYFFAGSQGISVNGLVVQGGGSVTLANNGNVLNGIDVQSGTLTISGAGNTPLAGTLRVASGATLALNNAQSLAVASQLTGEGVVSGSVTTPGNVDPGDGVGLLMFDNNLSLTSSSVTTFELGGLMAGTLHDVLAVNGQLSLNGVLAVSLVNGFQPTVGDEFSILVAGNVLGAFASESLPTLSGGLSWHTTYLPTEVKLSVAAAVIYDPADFNQDGHVDGDDLVLWRAGVGTLTGATNAQGDANGDSAVDGADFLIWQRRLSTTGIVPSAREIPEPSTWLLAAFSVCPLFHGARRRCCC